MKKRTPGEMLLKLSGMVILLLGIMMAVGGAGAMSLLVRGREDEMVLEYLKSNHQTFSQMTIGVVVSTVAGVLYLTAGILGIKNCADVKKAKICLVCGILLVAEVGLEMVYNAMLGQFQPVSVLSMLALPLLYLMGAIRNKQAENLV